MAPPDAGFAPGESIERFKTEVLTQRGLGDAKAVEAIMAKSEAWPFPASEDGWVKAHNAIRLDLKDLGEALDAVVERLGKGEALPPWVVTNLHTYFPKFDELVHHHHENEEDIVVPELKKIGCVMPDKMSTDHVGLLKAMAELKALVLALKSGQPASEDLVTFTALRDKFVAMRGPMEEHLQEEEDVCLPIMRKEITMKQFKPIEKKIIANISPELMGWFLRPFPNDQARKAWMSDIAGMPGFVQDLIMMPAYKKYRTTYARLVEEIKIGERILPEPTGCFGC